MFFFKFFSVILLLISFVNGEVQRITNGVPVTINKYPFAVALLTNSGAGSYSFGCGGTILTERAILSSASCFYTDNDPHPVSWWRARVGSTFNNAGGTIHVINRITAHPDFAPATLVNDIAVLRPTLPFNLVQGSVEKAWVSGGAYTFTQRDPVYAIGWGSVQEDDTSPSSELREALMYVVSQEECNTRYSALNFAITDNMVCAAWLDVGVVSQCRGDYGSPLVANNAVVAVLSRSECDSTGEIPGVNTRIAPYINWIRTLVYQ